MAIYPIPTEQKLALNKKLRTENKKKADGVKTPLSVEVKYRKQLLAITKGLRDAVKRDIIPLLKALEPEYTADAGYARSLEMAFTNLRRMYADIDTNAQVIANQFTEESNTVNRRKFYAAMNKAVGVNMETIVQNEGVEDTLIASTHDNVNLIKSIPDEYFKKIENIVYGGTVRGNRSHSMIKEITKLGYSTEKRARLIARDQTSKLNAALTQNRQQNLGIKEYVWRTAGDGRVRPAHQKNNGKTFRWDKPPKETGHPGQDIQCRCIAEPIIKL